jgi:hypothetical protein
MTTPLLIIHRRTPLEVDGITLYFTMYEYDEGGVFTEEVFDFTVPQESSYHQLDFSHVVLAEKTRDGSKDIRVYDIANQNGPSVVHKIPLTERVQVFTKIVEDYLKESKNDTR